MPALELRSKKQLIETFIAGINEEDNVMSGWHDYVVKQREEEMGNDYRRRKVEAGRYS